MGQYDNWPPFREPLMEPLADYMARKQRRREYVAALEAVAQAAREVVTAEVLRVDTAFVTVTQAPFVKLDAALDALTEGTDG